MADQFLIYHDPGISGPATHLLVIAVGAYPHLIGGSEATTPDHDGMRQLTSPPYSARALVNWFLGEPYHNPDKPLGSIAMLLSENNAQPYTHPRATNPKAVASATMANVRDAITEWKERGNSHPDNLMLFYFCGHGIAQGPDVALLCEDYGADQDAPLTAAINFTAFHQGMDRCKAAYQCFFIDACRTSSDTLIESYGFAGMPIVQPKKNARRGLAPRQAPVFYSTLAGEAAYGSLNQPSPFTQALIDAFKGTGASDRDGSWRIYTTELNTAVGTAVSSQGRQVQYPTTGNLTSFVLHHLTKPPVVPVTVGCRPKENNQVSTLLYRQNGVDVDQRPPAPDDWKVQVKTGSYQFVAVTPTGEIPSNPQDRWVGPPYRIVEIAI